MSEPDETFKEALERFRLRDYSAALALWRELQADGYDHPNLELFLAVARREQARVLQFAEDYGASLAGGAGEASGDEIELVEDPAARARALLRERRYSEAVGCLEEALLDPGADLFALRLALAQVQLILGHLQESLFHLEQARLMRPDAAEVSATMGGVFREMGRPLEAEREYRRALDLDPDDAASWYGLARLYHDQERYDVCESCVRKVLEIRPGAIHATTLLDEVRRKQEHAQTLIDQARTILDANPGYPDWHHRIAVYYTYTGAYDEACEHLEKALEINPRLVKSAYQLGLLQARAGRFARACEAFERCLEYLDLEESPEVRAARELASNGRFEEAAYEFSVVVVPEENSASRFIDLGKRLYAESFLPQARRELEKALELKPDYPDGHYVLGRVARDQGNLEEAGTHFKRALALSPYYQQAALALAQVELARGNVGVVRELQAQYGADPKPDLVAAWAEVAKDLESAGG